MTLLKRRWILALVCTICAALLTAIPFRMWSSQRKADIEKSIDLELVDLMEQVLYGEATDQRSDWILAWYVNANPDAGWADEFVDTDLEPPLLTWVREAGEWPSFREYELDKTTGLRGLVRPVRPNEAYVVLTYTSDRDTALADFATERRNWAVGLGLGCLALGAIISWLAIRPVRRLLGDQQSFLADAAHEMRTPLAVILASSSQALARDRTSEEYVRSLSEIRSAAERAATGVNEMLDLVRFETGQSIPRAAPLRLDLLAEEVAAAVRPDDVEIVAEPANSVVVQGDMALLRQAVENVVRNAARRSQRVELLTSSERGDGILSVVDNGPGFDPAVLPRVFERYQRGDRNGEVGIGLAIVKAIAVAHGGSVSAVNNDGGGATVSIRVPLARLA
jgi:signal transduction histidine kinase